MDFPKRETIFLKWVISVTICWSIILGTMWYLLVVYRYVSDIGFSLQSLVLLVGSVLFSWAIIGNRQHAIAILAHEGGHGLILQNPKWNDFITNVTTFYPLTASIVEFRRFHFAHHQYTSTSQDPEMVLKRQAAPNYDLPMKGRTSLPFLLMRDLLFLNFKELFYFILSITPKTFKEARGMLVFWGILVAIILYFQLYFVFALIAVWFVCLGTTFWAFFRIRIMTEHVGTPTVHRLKPKFIERILFFPYNIWCHYEHHAFSHIASPKLSQIRKNFNKEVKEDTFDGLLESYRHTAKVPSGTPLKEVHIPGIS